MCDYGNSDYLARQRPAFNYIYELPFGKGRRWLNTRGVTDAALGGWEIAGITTYSTGGFQRAFEHCGVVGRPAGRRRRGGAIYG